MHSMELDVENPLKDGETCRLLSNRADPKYYTHTYDPGAMIAKVRDGLQLSEEVLSRFDNVIRRGCCNVIAITLYVTERYCTLAILQKYLYSIHRSVKNVLKKLPDWIVRVYFDTSVEECVTKEEFKEFNEIFNAIKSSPNVEVYTYDCPSFKKGASGEESQIPIARTRTLRFLPLSDPEVNFCLVREADGIVSNLDCHNIKMYASNPNILFYLPLCSEVYNLMTNNANLTHFGSYSPWLRLYKLMFAYDYFKELQNLYDLLAGAFCCKLKLKKDYYQATVKSLQGKIDMFYPKLAAEPPFMRDTGQIWSEETKSIRNFIMTKPVEVLNQLAIGFDEILLLEMFKELICVKIILSVDPYSGSKFDTVSTTRSNIMANMIMADNIPMVSSSEQQLHFVIEDLYLKLIGHRIISEQDIKTTISKFPNVFVDFNYYIDSILLGNITTDQPFNIKVGAGNRAGYVSQLLNAPYDPSVFDNLYDSDQMLGHGGGKRKRRFSRKIKKQSRHRRKRRMRKSRRNSRK